jgi:hypothetical protein
MQGWDFTSPGWYFITICTQGMRSEFGTVVNGRMMLNQAGLLADRCWREIPAHFPRAVVDEHVVMPDHVHGLLHLVYGATACRGSMDTACRGPLEAFGKPVAGSVPTIVRSYKAAVSRALGYSPWQGRFYEVRARTELARANIRRYLRDNPRNYHALANAGAPQYWGNRVLLDLPKVGFLASRGKASLPDAWPARSGEVILSAFLSPMERAVFQAGLARKQPMIWVQPWGLTACREAMEEGRLLVLSPFAADIASPSARRAAWCNQYVIAHANRLVVGHLTPDGMLACILSEASPDKEIACPGR